MKRLVLLYTVLVFAVSCANSQAYKDVTATEFKTLIEKNDGNIIDARSLGEFQRGYIKGAQLYNTQEPLSVQKLLLLPKNKPMYVYCYSGSRSRFMASFLTQNGFTNVYNLQRGIMEWNALGFPIEKGVAANTPQEHVMTIPQYNALLQSNSLVFIDYYAPWCAPCKQMMPMMEDLKKEYKNKIVMDKVNTDGSKELIQFLGIQGVPNLVLYKNGAVVYTHTGLVTKDELRKVFEEQLKK